MGEEEKRRFNQEHYDRLVNGTVEEWNKWREENPDIVPELEGADLQKRNLKNINLRNAYLEYANINKCNLDYANLSMANLKGVTGWMASFKNAILAEVDFEGTILQLSNFEYANLIGANFRFALLWGNTNFNRTNLQDATLENAMLKDATFVEANLWYANLKGADLRYVNLEKSNCLNVQFNRRCKYKGIRLAGSYGSKEFIKFAEQRSFEEEFRDSSKLKKIAYYTWLITSDCGRSAVIWFGWSVLLVLVFAFTYYKLDLLIENAFTFSSKLPRSISSFIYYSVVTFTTLGFGDIIPNSEKVTWIIMFEVFIGYFMLGSLVSYFAKLFNRS